MQILWLTIVVSVGLLAIYWKLSEINKALKRVQPGLTESADE